MKQGSEGNMSGGSYDYISGRVEEAAGMVARRADGAPNESLRRAFAAHLELVSIALHDLEWVDSGDTSPGDEEAAIRKVISPEAELAMTVQRAEKALEALRGALEAARPQAKAPIDPALWWTRPSPDIGVKLLVWLLRDGLLKGTEAARHMREAGAEWERHLLAISYDLLPPHVRAAAKSDTDPVLPWN
jgi:hypothetical protein